MRGNKKRATGLVAVLIFSFLMTACVSYNTNSENRQVSTVENGQIIENARISFLGPEGTYTEEAAQYFFKNSSFQPKETVPDAIADIKNKTADYAVIPQENTLGGPVTNYIDALISEGDIYVVGEVVLPINQTLMGLPGASIDDIRVVCSHAQGIAQSEKWRKEHMPGIPTQEMASTAAAASYVSESGDKTIAAIAAPGAAKLYGLSILAENVQISDANKTRFYVLAASGLEGRSFTNAAFVATCEASRIDDIIIEIHDAGLEMVSIHDRPEGSQLGKYNYIIEVENKAGISDENIVKLEAIPEMRYLGRFNVMIKQNEN